MRSYARISILALLTGAVIALSAPAAQAAFGVEHFFAGNCGETYEECGLHGASATEAEYFTQAAGHPNFGVTDFVLNNKKIQSSPVPAFQPEGSIESVRTDVPPGVATNPQAAPKCSQADFKGEEALPGFFEESKCPASSIVGKSTTTVLVYEEIGHFYVNLELEGTVYNLEPSYGLPLEFGIAVSLAEVGYPGYFSHNYLEGGVEWSGDYHEYFKIKPFSNTIPILETRLVFKGNVEPDGLLTNPSECAGRLTTHLTVESYAKEKATAESTTPSGLKNCNLVEFKPTLEVQPETTQYDTPDGVTTVLKVPQHEKSSEPESADLKSSTVTLPEGLTLNPSAANGLEGCTPEQIGIGTSNGVTCPGRSAIGTVALEVPGLPAGALTGAIYLGKPAGKAIEGPPYTIYLDAESARYGQKVRLKGVVTPNSETGRLVTTFSENPQAPFTELKLHFTGGALANLANPLVCGAAKTASSLTPFSAAEAVASNTEFAVDSNGLGGACASPLPFAPTQSTSSEPAKGGASSTFTLNLERPEGQQYVGKIRDVLPPGLLGLIPSVTQCAEAQANAGTCTSASQIGTVAVAAGSGEPYPFKGKVYLTGPYEGAPYGLSIVVPAVSGPFNLGNVIARAKIEVDPYTARVILTDNNVPTIVGGIPIRMRSLSISINRQGFELNPTNCGALAINSALTSTLGAIKEISTPFQAEGCNTLGFKPSFSASTSGNPSKANGASLETTINQGAGQANIAAVVVQLPKQLPSRLTTLQKACPEATFAVNPYNCPTASRVGGARANTPVLPSKMTGPAYLVSRGGAAFPDLDLVLEANGVRVIVVGNTNITKSITTTHFRTTPDVPVSSITVNLPVGPHSALAAYGDLCVTPLVMPTTITAQNGAVIKQNTKIAVTGCGVRIVGHKVIGNTAYLTIKTFAAGRISGGGSGLSTVYRALNGPSNATTLKVPLSGGGRSRRRPFSTSVRVGFVPKHGGAHSSASVTVRFR